MILNEGSFHEGRWYEDTGMICRRCGHPVYRSDLAEYAYQCFHCDEDLYSFEAMEPDAYLLGHGVAEADLEMVYYVEADEEDYNEG